jgi:hypothetical protein
MEIEVKEIHKSGMYSIFGPHGKHVPAYYRTEAEAQADLDTLSGPLLDGILYMAEDGRRLVADHFHRVRGTIPHKEGYEIEFREMWREYEVQADSLPDFMQRYYKPDRYHGRGEEYAAVLLAGHQEDFDRDGYDVISHWDSVTGQTVAFFGPHAHQCCSCEQTFSQRSPYRRECPHCGSGNFVDGYIDEPEVGNDTEHQAALERIDTLMDAAPRTAEESELDRLSTQVETYEEKAFPISQASQPTML